MNTSESGLELTVYCGSGPGDDPAFVKAGHDLGQIFSQEGVRGRFGGGSVGVMGAFASSMFGHGGYLTAVIPQGLVEKEQPIRQSYPNGYDLIITPDMYERKRLFRKSHGFVALPGGSGTRDEIWEEITGIQIGDHRKPLVLVNIKDSFKYLLLDIEQMRRQKFIREGLEFQGLFAVVETAEEVLPAMRRMLGHPNVNVTPIRSAG